MAGEGTVIRAQGISSGGITAFRWMYLIEMQSADNFDRLLLPEEREVNGLGPIKLGWHREKPPRP